MKNAPQGYGPGEFFYVGPITNITFFMTIL